MAAEKTCHTREGGCRKIVNASEHEKAGAQEHEKAGAQE